MNAANENQAKESRLLIYLQWFRERLLLQPRDEACGGDARDRGGCETPIRQATAGSGEDKGGGKREGARVSVCVESW